MAALRPLRSAIFVAALILLVLACRVENAPWGEAGTRGTPAPEFTLPDLFGNRVSLADQRGKPVVVDFWATWCAPCAKQIPVLNAFLDAHYGEVVVLGIAVDAGGIEAVAPYANEHEIEYPVLLGDEELAQAYGAFGFPSLYVIASDGTIAANHIGVITREELE